MGWDVRADVHSRTHQVARRLCGRGLWMYVCASCANCRTGLPPKEWPMCARCYARTYTAVATEGAIVARIDPQSAGVCTENSDSNVLVMQAAHQGMRYDGSGALNRARDGRILV